MTKNQEPSKCEGAVTLLLRDKNLSGCMRVREKSVLHMAEKML